MKPTSTAQAIPIPIPIPIPGLGALADAPAAVTAPAQAPAPGVLCPCCHVERERLAHGQPVCAPCLRDLDARANTAQERAELAAWLSTRADAAGAPDPELTTHDRRVVLRLVNVARASGVDWTDPASYARRRASDSLAELLASYRPGSAAPRRGRPARRQRMPAQEGGAA